MVNVIMAEKKELIELINRCEDKRTLKHIENIIKCESKIDMTDKFRWNRFSDDVEYLIFRVGQYEEFFFDMQFKSNNTKDLIMVKALDDDSEEWFECDWVIPEELDYFSYTWFNFKVEDLPDCNGRYDLSNQTLTISPECLNDDRVILHELIHLHESVINSLPMYFHDSLLWALYQDLIKKIPELNEIVSSHGHILTGETITSLGGDHDILFLLKSFDIDIRMGYPLGTVFGYGRQEDFEGYSYIK